MTPKKKKKSNPDDPRYVAAVDLIGRTGADQFKIQYCEEDAPPIIWMASAHWGDRWETAAALNPLRAIFRLLDEVIDGGLCVHCHRPTGFEESMEPMLLDNLICWYQWDPSNKKFERGCAV
jgi:hypothetical protein